MRHLLLLPFALTACEKTYDSIDDACPDKVPGSQDSDAVSIEVFRRVGCYRRFANLGPAHIDDRISDAARAHALYVEQNGPEDFVLLEDPQKPAFTGEDPLARMVAQGYELEGTDWDRSYGYWEGLFLNDPSFDPTEIADGWMWGQYERQGVLQPDWVDAGYGATDSYAVITILYDFPAEEAIARPVAWPRDGQTDVPPMWVYHYDDGAVPLFAEVGYPITFTVGSDDRDSNAAADNPYDLVQYDTSIEGPDGFVDHVIVTPDSALYDFPYTVALIPDVPFAANTTYTATARLRWNGRDSTGEFVTTFTTGADTSTTSRAVPQPLRVVSRAPGRPLHAWRP